MLLDIILPKPYNHARSLQSMPTSKNYIKKISAEAKTENFKNNELTIQYHTLLLLVKYFFAKNREVNYGKY